MNRIRNIVKRARLSLVGDDDLPFAQSQAEFSGTTADYQALWPYGIHANAPVDSHLVLFQNEGKADDIFGFATAPALRQKNLRSGEVVIGNFVKGCKLFFNEDGDLIVTVPGDHEVTVSGNVTINVSGTADITVDGDVTMTAPNTEINSNVTINGTLDVTGEANFTTDIFSNGKNIGDTHTHGGVQTGSGTSGPVS